MNLIKTTAALALCMTFAFAGAVQAYAREPVYVTDTITDDDFSSGKIPNSIYQVGSNNGGTAGIYEYGGDRNYVVRVGADGATTSIGPVFAIRLQDRQCDFDLEFDICATTTDIDYNLKVYDWAQSSPRYKLNILQLKNGEVIPTGEGGSSENAEFEAEKWYRFKVKLYTDGNRYDLYMAEYDGSVLGEYRQLAEGRSSVNAAMVKGFNSFQFNTAATTPQGGYTYIDNVLCTMQSELPYVEEIYQSLEEPRKVYLKIGGKLDETDMLGKVRLYDELGQVELKGAEYNTETSVMTLTSKRSLNEGMTHGITIDKTVLRDGGFELGMDLEEVFECIPAAADVVEGSFTEIEEGTRFDAYIKNTTDTEKSFILIVTNDGSQRAVECTVGAGSEARVSAPPLPGAYEAFAIGSDADIISSKIWKK